MEMIRCPNPKCRRRILDDEGTETEWTILEIKFLEISTDGTFYAECITWLCHPKQAVEVYGICMAGVKLETMSLAYSGHFSILNQFHIKNRSVSGFTKA